MPCAGMASAVHILKNIILKTALITLGVVIALAVVMFAILSLAFPGTLCGWCEQLGNYGFAVKYASLYYSYTGDVADLARCAEDGILSGKNGYITEYCTKLVDDEGFPEYCTLRDEQMAEDLPELSFSYRQYIYGAAAEAYYREGDSDLAVGFAIEALDENFSRAEYSTGGEADYSIDRFPVNNALGSLALVAIEKEDGELADELTAILSSVRCSSQDEQDYLSALTGALGAI